MENVILPSTYLGNIAYFKEVVKQEKIVIETKEHFPKQTYRNRCEILSANGKLKLIIPLRKWKNHSSIDQIKISNDYNWQQLHWKSLIAAYRSSPFFEFYEDHFSPFYQDKTFDYLLDFNNELLRLILDILKIEVSISFTDEFKVVREGEKDLRDAFTPKKKVSQKFEPYLQVFSDKLSFTDNLSIIDLLFNQGPGSLAYLKGAVDE